MVSNELNESFRMNNKLWLSIPWIYDQIDEEVYHFISACVIGNLLTIHYNDKYDYLHIR